MTVEDNIAPELIAQLEVSSRYRRTARARSRSGTARIPVIKRGIALTPVKFGISFTATHYNQAGALLHLYSDGTLLLNHGGTEMGQGLFTKVAQVVAQELGVPLADACASRRRTRARCRTRRRPPPRPAATSTAWRRATPRARCASGSSRSPRASSTAIRSIVEFAGGVVTAGGKTLPFAELARMAYIARVPLSATGFYATPKIHYDRKTLTGRPFFYFAYGAAVSEVAIDTLTGEHRLLAVDILHDVGHVAQSGASTAARSKAASSRAGAGSRWKSCGGTTRAS